MKHYPAWRYHKELAPRVIHNEKQHELLESEGWAETPAAFEEPKKVDPGSELDQRLQDLKSEEQSETQHESEDAPNSPADQETQTDAPAAPTPSKKVFGKGRR